jgi:cytochrome c peroxidase
MKRIVLALTAAAGLLAAFAGGPSAAQTWSQEELATLRGLWIGSLPALPKDPSNAWGDDTRAAKLGHRFFFDTRFSGNGEVSCASCHQPELAFTDGLALAKGMGTTARHTPTIIGAAHSPWFFWDGRKDSQWSQALGPLESPVEHGATRTQIVKIVFADTLYRGAYEEIFGPLPDLSDAGRFPSIAAPSDVPASNTVWAGMADADQNAVSLIYANIGKAIAAYERLILPGPSRFDGYADAILRGDGEAARAALTDDEVAGLRLFMGKGNCTECHNGPLFTNNDFHNTSLPAPAGLPQDVGRAEGIKSVLGDEFNCLGTFSDAGPGACGELKFAKREGPELVGSFKSPTLRNVAETAPYMHDGRFATLAAVLDHYNRAPPTPLGHSELKPLGLSPKELSQLEIFMRTLSGPLGVAPELLLPPR